MGESEKQASRRYIERVRSLNRTQDSQPLAPETRAIRPEARQLPGPASERLLPQTAPSPEELPGVGTPTRWGHGDPNHDRLRAAESRYCQ